jgi:Glycosyl transferase family 11
MQNKAVIVALTGGLGNQLFQYAAGKSLASRWGADLLWDLSWFNEVKHMSNTTVREFALEPFNLNIRTHNLGHNIPVPSGRIGHALSRALTEFLCKIQRIKVVKERTFNFDPSVFSISPTLRLEGYWQSLKYFRDIENTIRSEIGTVRNINTSSAKLLKEIRESDSICVHIRRGDYISNPSAAQTHGICMVNYYKKGLECVSQGMKSPHCFVFSDDPNWVRTDFSIPIPMTLVDINGPSEAYQDLWLMSACKKFVIANSSLSWWGAWLGTNPNKVVVAPKKWFLGEDKNTSDLIPSEWIRL